LILPEAMPKRAATVYTAPLQRNGSQVLVVIANGHVLRLLQLPLMLGDERRVNLDLRRLRELANELQVPLVGEATGEPQEGLLKVVVAPRTEVVVLEVALPVELYVLGLDLAVLHINLVSHQDYGNVLANAHDVSVPVWNILVGNTRRDVKHNHRALSLDVVPISQTTKLLLPGSVPHVEGEQPAVGAELQRMHLHTERRDILLFKLTGQVPLHQGCLPHTAIPHQHELELRASGTSTCRHCERAEN